MGSNYRLVNTAENLYPDFRGAFVVRHGCFNFGDDMLFKVQFVVYPATRSFSVMTFFFKLTIFIDIRDNKIDIMDTKPLCRFRVAKMIIILEAFQLHTDLTSVLQN